VGALQVLSTGDEPATRGDDFGFDPQFTERIKGIALWMYRNYFRVEVDGIRNVPASGRALLAANHAGVVPYDGAMIRTSIIAEHPRPRHARMLVVDWAFALPYLSMLLTKTGNVLAHPDNAATLLERDELVGVFPEGVKGAAKRYSNRYHVQRLGRGGFVQVALRTGAPIVPVAVVGSEEVHPRDVRGPATRSIVRVADGTDHADVSTAGPCGSASTAFEVVHRIRQTDQCFAFRR